EPIAAVLADLVADPARWRDFGRAARARYLSLFSEASAAEGIEAMVRTTLRRPTATDPSRAADAPARPAA
ncbi:MAG: glycosyltransferase family 1 protein, partial [Methylobacterium radiotolerans]